MFLMPALIVHCLKILYKEGRTKPGSENTDFRLPHFTVFQFAYDQFYPDYHVPID